MYYHDGKESLWLMMNSLCVREKKDFRARVGRFPGAFFWYIEVLNYYYFLGGEKETMNTAWQRIEVTCQ